MTVEYGPEYEWLPDPEWYLAEEGRKCTIRGCGRPAVAMFYRQRRYSQPYLSQSHYILVRWHCCARDDHMYGRRVRDGCVERQYLIGAPDWEQMKATQNSGAGKEA